MYADILSFLRAKMYNYVRLYTFYSIVRSIYHVVAIMRISKFILLLKLQLLAASLVAANIDANVECIAENNSATGPNIEIYYLEDIELSVSSMQCTWHRFTVGDISQPIGNGNRFDWNQTQSGYGQFNCIRMDRTVAKKLLILPFDRK